MNFPKGINKIIEDYCCYEHPFELELLKRTLQIFSDTKRYISYSDYYIDSYTGKIFDNISPFKIRKIRNNWKVSSK